MRKRKESDQRKTNRRISMEKTRVRAVTRADVQRRCAQANFLAGKLTDAQVEDIRTRYHGPKFTEIIVAIAKAYGLDRFVIERVVMYGKLSPWEHACLMRAQSRTGKRLAWEQRQAEVQGFPVRVKSLAEQSRVYQCSAELSTAEYSGV